MFEQLITVVFVAIVLGLDAFSLALGYGLRGISRANALKFTGTITIYHILMPLIGLNIGMAAGKLLGIWAARLGAAALAYIGLEMLIKGYQVIKTRTVTFAEVRSVLEPTAQKVIKLKEILLLGFLVSIDALTVGFGLGTLRVSILLTCLIIGTIAGVMTLTGFFGGGYLAALLAIMRKLQEGLYCWYWRLKCLSRGDSVKKILLVCSGNTCRSPMAKIIMEQLLKNANIHNIAVESAGLYTTNGLPASEAAQIVMQEMGMDISTHTSQVVNEELMTEADLILAMTREHRRFLTGLFPQKKHQIFTLGEFIGQPELDIEDPYGLGLEAYRKSVQQLKEILTVVMNFL